MSLSEFDTLNSIRPTYKLKSDDQLRVCNLSQTRHICYLGTLADTPTCKRFNAAFDIFIAFEMYLTPMTKCNTPGWKCD